MAEGIRFTSESDVESPESDEKSKKKKKASIKLGEALVDKGEKPESAPEQAEKPEKNAWDKLLAGILGEKDEKAAEVAKAELAWDRLGKENVPTVELEPTRELSDDELSSGEVIIDLHSPVEASGENFEADFDAADHAQSAELPDDADVEDATPTPVVASTGGPRATSSSSTGGSGSGRSSGSGPRGGGRSSGTSGAGSGGSSGGSGRTPPPSGGTAAPPPGGPSGPSSPGTYTGYTAPSYNAPPPTSGNTLQSVLAQQRAAEQAYYYGRQRGRGEAFLGGAILGGLIEHFRHKSRERKMEKKTKTELKKRDQQIESLNFERQQLKTEQLEQARKAEAERYANKIAANQELAATAQAQMSEVAAVKRAKELKLTAEQQEREKAALIDRLNAQATEQEQLAAEQLAANENRIETSAWHSIEVDKHGHAVQETNIVYGHEYYRERGHETGPKDTATRSSATGATALTGLAGGSAADDQTNHANTLGVSPVDGGMSDGGTNGRSAPAGIDSQPPASFAALVPWIVILVAVSIVAIIVLW